MIIVKLKHNGLSIMFFNICLHLASAVKPFLIVINRVVLSCNIESKKILEKLFEKDLGIIVGNSDCRRQDETTKVIECQ